MLDLKALLTKILNTLQTHNSNISALTSRYVVQAHSTSAYSITANGAHSVALTVTRSGYTPLGIMGYSTSGSYSGYSVATSFYMSDRKSGSGVAHAYVTNRGSTASTWTTTFYVLWQRNI